MSEVDEEAQGKPCLSKVCSGEAGCALNLLCCPVVMLFNAYDIYLRPLLFLYLFQILDGIFCAPFRLICCACCCRHTDKAFPPSPSSIGEWDGKKGRALNEIIEWERASKYFGERLTDDQKKRGVRVKLFDKGINPEDVAQGQLGNCWLIAAMACLAEHPGLLRRVFKTRRASKSGRYIMNLYDGQEGTWKNISVDENIPVRKSDRSLLFANPHGNEMWVIMLEKAFAKFCGSYAALAGGHTLWAFHTVTGDPVFALKRRDDGSWVRQNLKFTKDDSDKRSMAFYTTQESYDSDKTFFLLRKFCRIKTLLGAAINNAGEFKRDDGLVAGHAYSVLDARSFTSSNARINLIQLRNPWGAHEWKGAWSDGSPEWGKYPKIRNAIKHAKGNDGRFWMNWEDFSRRFDRVDVCQRSTGLRDLSLDLKEADGCANCIGPCIGCCQGCFGYWCGCKGCRALYCGVKVSKETASIGPTGPDDSVLVMMSAAVGGQPQIVEIER